MSNQTVLSSPNYAHKNKNDDGCNGCLFLKNKTNCKNDINHIEALKVLVVTDLKLLLNV